MAKLNGFVTVHQKDEAGNVVESHTFGPDDDLPDWAVDTITNPAVWEEVPSSTAKHAAAGGIPKKAGPGASSQAWAAYAEGKVDVPEGATRDQIIGLLDAAGVPTE